MGVARGNDDAALPMRGLAATVKPGGFERRVGGDPVFRLFERQMQTHGGGRAFFDGGFRGENGKLPTLQMRNGIGDAMVHELGAMVRGCFR